MKVTDYIAEYIKQRNVQYVFGYQGSSIAHMIDSISKTEGLCFIETRHEQAAAFAANAYALTNGMLGVAIACSGPGAINLLSGVANAYYDSIPCLFITGQVSQREMKNERKVRQLGFQETDIISLVKPITKYAVSINNVNQIQKELTKAVNIAFEGRKGPVLIEIPHNIQSMQIEKDTEILEKIDKSQEKGLSKKEYDIIREKIKLSKRPVILIGGGCKRISLDIVKKMVIKEIPVVSSYRGKEKYDNTSDNYCGVVGSYGHRVANWVLKYSDLLICIGTRLDGRQTNGETIQLQKEQNIIVIDIDEEELSKLPTEYYKINMSSERFLVDFFEILGSFTLENNWLKTVKKWMNRYRIENEYLIKNRVNPNYFLKILSNAADDKTNFTTDVGQNQIWTNTSLNIGHNQTLLQSCGLGTMGFALPAAMGAYLANKNMTVCITGDGGIQMNIQELQTIQQYDMLVKVFIFNNGCLGLIRDYQSKALAGRYYGSIDGFGSPDYEYIAQAYGMKYIKITNNKCEKEIEDILNNPERYLVEVLIDTESTAYPEPTYGESILEQSYKISESERRIIEGELDEC